MLINDPVVILEEAYKNLYATIITSFDGTTHWTKTATK